MDLILRFLGILGPAWWARRNEARRLIRNCRLPLSRLRDKLAAPRPQLGYTIESEIAALRTISADMPYFSRGKYRRYKIELDRMLDNVDRTAQMTETLLKLTEKIAGPHHS